MGKNMPKYAILDAQWNRYSYQHLDCYHQGLDRAGAERRLAGSPNGTFLVRDSSITKGTYLAISVVQNGEISHELVCLETGYLEQQDPRATFVRGIGEYLDSHYDTNKAIKNSFAQPSASTSSKIVTQFQSLVIQESTPPEELKQEVSKDSIAFDILRLHSDTGSKKAAFRNVSGEMRQMSRRDSSDLLHHSNLIL